MVFQLMKLGAPASLPAASLGARTALSARTSNQQERGQPCPRVSNEWLVLLFVLFIIGGIARAADEPRPLFVEGYAGRVSYAPGEELTLHVSTSARNFAVEIARLGAKREIIWSSPTVEGRELPVPEDASSHGCRWPADG